MERIPSQFCTAEFKEDVVKFVTEGGLGIAEASRCLGVVKADLAQRGEPLQGRGQGPVHRQDRCSGHGEADDAIVAGGSPVSGRGQKEATRWVDPSF